MRQPNPLMYIKKDRQGQADEQLKREYAADTKEVDKILRQPWGRV